MLLFTATPPIWFRGGDHGDIFVRDLVGGKTIWASTNARAISQSLYSAANAVSCNYSISDDGQFVAFEVCTNFPSGGPPGLGIILRYHLPTGLTDIICTNAVTPSLPFANIHDLAMTPDGRFTALVAYVGTISGTNTAIYLWDAQTGTNTLVSANLDNSGPANGLCDSPVVSSNGQFVAFTSSATNLITNSCRVAGMFIFATRKPASPNCSMPTRMESASAWTPTTGPGFKRRWQRRCV